MCTLQLTKWIESIAGYEEETCSTQKDVAAYTCIHGFDCDYAFAITAWNEPRSPYYFAADIACPQCILNYNHTFGALYRASLAAGGSKTASLHWSSKFVAPKWHAWCSSISRRYITFVYVGCALSPLCRDVRDHIVRLYVDLCRYHADKELARKLRFAKDTTLSINVCA